MFSIEKKSGVLLFEEFNEDALLINETVNEIIILANDNGQPNQWNWTSVTVQFTMDTWSATAPFFFVPIYQVNVFENTPPGTVIVHSTAVNRAGITIKEWKYRLKDNDEVIIYFISKFMYFLQTKTFYR